MRIRFKLLSQNAIPPQRMTPDSVGWDLSAALCEEMVLNPGARAAIPTGLALEIPQGYEGQIRPRSGLALKLGLGVLNSPGTIDPDYRGELKVILINSSTDDVVIRPGMRIAQIIICPVALVEFEQSDELGQSQRSDGGFGHTGN
ncbi:MAG: dUTP diphosphatase [Candidatus Cloacimonetes bacterium]|nr:dUTP diphosphatase [Candidatus Cloacimonadota bacterium]